MTRKQALSGISLVMDSEFKNAGASFSHNQESREVLNDALCNKYVHDHDVPAHAAAQKGKAGSFL